MIHVSSKMRGNFSFFLKMNDQTKPVILIDYLASLSIGLDESVQQGIITGQLVNVNSKRSWAVINHYLILNILCDNIKIWQLMTKWQLHVILWIKWSWKGGDDRIGVYCKRYTIMCMQASLVIRLRVKTALSKQQSRNHCFFLVEMWIPTQTLKTSKFRDLIGLRACWRWSPRHCSLRAGFSHTHTHAHVLKHKLCD